MHSELLFNFLCSTLCIVLKLLSGSAFEELELGLDRIYDQIFLYVVRLQHNLQSRHEKAIMIADCVLHRLLIARM